MQALNIVLLHIISRHFYFKKLTVNVKTNNQLHFQF